MSWHFRTREGVSDILLSYRSGQAPEEGALAEVDEKKLLDYILQHPEQYQQMLPQILSLPGISQKERTLFENASPVNKAVAATVTADAATVGTGIVQPTQPAV